LPPDSGISAAVAKGSLYGTREKNSSMGDPERCDWGGCLRSVVITFVEECLVVDDYFNLCYEILDAMEAGKRLNPAGSA